MPLFPLSAPALFPHSAAPLHVFEPRYRALVADALATDRRIGMATVRPEALAAMAGDPPLHAIGCAGLIAEHQRLEDGRALLLLQATARFRIVSEPARPAERLYRVAQVELLEDPLGDERAAHAQRAHALRELRELGRAGRLELDLARLEALNLARFSGEVSRALPLPPREKQALLEAPSLAARLEALAQSLAFYRALAERTASRGPTLH
jgi:hypothetical protein